MCLSDYRKEFNEILEIVNQQRNVYSGNNNGGTSGNSSSGRDNSNTNTNTNYNSANTTNTHTNTSNTHNTPNTQPNTPNTHTLKSIIRQYENLKCIQYGYMEYNSKCVYEEVYNMCDCVIL